MLKILRQLRSATSLVNPDDIRKRAIRPVNVGLVASSDAGYRELQEFLLPPNLSRETRLQLMTRLHRADDPEAAHEVDIVLYEHGVVPGNGAFALDRHDPEATVRSILKDNDELALALARQFPQFRPVFTDHLVKTIARENAIFSLATALPNVLPSLMELPLALTEYASDTVFLTGNQVRMAFLVAGAYNQEIGLSTQKAQVASIVAGAFGWRALARQLVGKIPLGGGLIPKGAIAYAGTFAVGKGLEYYQQNHAYHTREQSESVYREGFSQGRAVAESIRAQRR